jgi:hypothetical protein
LGKLLGAFLHPLFKLCVQHRDLEVGALARDIDLMKGVRGRCDRDHAHCDAEKHHQGETELGAVQLRPLACQAHPAEREQDERDG